MLPKSFGRCSTRSIDPPKNIPIEIRPVRRRSRRSDVIEAKLGAKVGAEALVALDVAESAALDAIK